MDARLDELRRTYREAAHLGDMSHHLLHEIASGRWRRQHTAWTLVSVAAAISVPPERVFQVATPRARQQYVGDPLQQLVARRMEELRITYREAAARSGGALTSEQLNSLANGRRRRPRNPETAIRGLARALDLDLFAVEAAWYYDEAEPSPDTPP